MHINLRDLAWSCAVSGGAIAAIRLLCVVVAAMSGCL